MPEKRRSSGGSAGGGGACCCIALFGPFYFLYTAMNRESVLESKRWAGQPWINTTAHVLDAGIEYKGNCWLHDGGMRPCFKETCVGQTGYELFDEVTSKPRPGEEMVGARRLRGCHNSYLPWAKVQFPNGDPAGVCAFQYGIGDLDDIVYDSGWAYGLLPPVGSTVTVHSLVSAPCVAVLGDLAEMVKERREASAGTFYWIWIILPCTICAWLVVCYLAVMCCYAVVQPVQSQRESAYLGGQAAENLHELDAFSRRLTLPPGHWSQWDGDDVVLAANKLFDYFDKDRSGYLDVDEMVSIMSHLGIRDRHLVLRTMVQLDADESGVIERSEFEDLCRQIFWNGHHKLVGREFARQQEIMGNQAVSATGLSKNRPLLWAEVIILSIALGSVVWLEKKYGHQPCDTRFDRYLNGAAVLIGFQILFLFSIACCKSSALSCCFGSATACLQASMAVLNLFVLTYAITGTVMWVTSELCDPDLRTVSLVVVMTCWVAALYVLFTVIAGLVAACYVVRQGTNLTSLSLDDDPDSDSEYEEVDIED